MRRRLHPLSRFVPHTSVSLPLALVLLAATCAQLVWRGLATGQDGRIIAAGMLFFGVLADGVGIVLYLPPDHL